MSCQHGLVYYAETCNDCELNSLKDRVLDLESQCMAMREALEYSYAHLESMDNYSLVSGARHQMYLALKTLERKVK